MKVSQILFDAKMVIADKANWTQGTYARDEERMPINSSSSRAVCFCALGAVGRALRNNGMESLHTDEGFVRDVKLTLQQGCGGMDVASYNDSHSHTAVMEAFDRAITLATNMESRREKISTTP